VDSRELIKRLSCTWNALKEFHIGLQGGGDAELGRQAPYRLLSKQGNPELETLTRVLRELGFRLAVLTSLAANPVEPAPAQASPELEDA